MKFKMHGTLMFSANNIGDAFMKLSTHFSDLASGIDSQLAEVGTDIQIEPVEE